jgi:hypothetical protein
MWIRKDPMNDLCEQAETPQNMASFKQLIYYIPCLLIQVQLVTMALCTWAPPTKLHPDIHVESIGPNLYGLYVNDKTSASECIHGREKREK